MIEHNFSGTYYEIGTQYGQILKKSGFKLPIPPEVEEKRQDFIRKCEKKVKNHIPGVIDFFKGISDGSGISYSEIINIPMGLMYGLNPIPSCTIIALSGKYTQDGKNLFIRNYDWEYSSEEYFQKMQFNLNNGIKSIHFTDFWGGCYGGINEEGLIIAISSGQSYKDAFQPGISMPLICMWILNQFKSIEQAINFLKEVPHIHGFNYVLCDHYGKMARVETCPKKVAVEYFSDSYIIKTNHFLSNEMKFFENSNNIPPSSKSRYINAEKWIEENKGKITRSKAENFARLSTKKGGICDDGQFEQIKFGTIWSWIYEFNKKDISITPGSPWRNEYKNYNIFV